MLQGIVPDFQLSAIRLFMQAVVAFTITKWNKNLYVLEITDLPWMTAAVIGYLLDNFGLFGASKCLPLAEHGAFDILFKFITMAILFCIFQSKLPGKVNVLAMLLCFVGTILVIQPSFFFAQKAEDINTSIDACSLNNITRNCSDDFHNSNHDSNIYCYFLLIVGVTGNSLYSFSIGHKLLHISISSVVFWMSFGSFVLALPATFYIESINVTFISNHTQTALVLGHCLAAGLSITFGGTGVRLLGGLRFTIVSSFVIPLELFTQYVFLQRYKPGNHNFLEVTGVAIVTIGIALPGLLEYFKDKYGGSNKLVMNDLRM